MPAFLLRARTAVTNYRLGGLAKRNDFDPRDALLVFSDPRGGSTWITEMIQQIPRTAVVWEPLHLRYTDAFRELGFTWRQYIPEHAEWEEARAAFERVLRGQILNEKLGSASSIKEFAQADQLIVKLCRGNALLPWLVRQFEFRHKAGLPRSSPVCGCSVPASLRGMGLEVQGNGCSQGPIQRTLHRSRGLLEEPHH